MVCHRCGATVQPSHRFCGHCGASLAGVTDSTEPMPRPSLYDFAADPDDVVDDGPGTERVGVLAPAAPPPTSPPRSPSPAPSTSPPPPPGATTTAVRNATPVGGFAPPPTSELATTAMPSTAPPAPRTDSTVELPLVVLDVGQEPLTPRFSIGPLLLLSFAVAVLGVVGAVGTMVEVSTDAVAPAFETGEWALTDLGTNLSFGVVLCAAGLLIGGIAAGARQRWGAGLAGGAGLALAGLVGVIAGLAEQPIQLAQTATNAPGQPPFTVSVTRDVGYVVLGVAAAGGVLVFLASLWRARRDRGQGLNPWIAALGAVATMVAAAGPLVPEGNASVSSNWTSGAWSIGGVAIDQPAVFFAGRLLQLALLALCGVVGFLLVRSYGLGLVVGGLIAVTWLSATTLLEIGDRPVGPAAANPGSASVDLHAVTIVGMVALAGLAIVAVIAAIDQGVRER